MAIVGPDELMRAADEWQVLLTHAMHERCSVDDDWR